MGDWKSDNGTRPCPFCGASEEDDFEEFIFPPIGIEELSNRDSAVRCKNCGALGPPCGIWAQAQIAWNQRAEDD